MAFRGAFQPKAFCDSDPGTAIRFILPSHKCQNKVQLLAATQTHLKKLKIPFLGCLSYHMHLCCLAFNFFTL